MGFYTTIAGIFGLSLTSEELALVVLAFLVGIVGTIILTPVAMRVAEKAGVLDYPHARRVHTKPTPRWGGLAMYTAFLFTIGVLLRFHRDLHNPRVLGIVVGGLLITALGALDDKFSVPAKLKLLGQIVAATVMTFFGVRFVVFFDLNIHPVVGSILSVMWVVTITNTINLIDGLDGLAAGISGIAAFTLVAIAFLMHASLGFTIMAAALAGVCLGFLRYNFNPAKVFMGDAGSHFLGFTIGALSILQNWKIATGVAFFVPVLILAVPIFDTGFAIVRRLRRGQPIFSADKGHLHHRLLSLGLDQRTVVLTIYIITAIGCALALLLAHARQIPG